MQIQSLDQGSGQVVCVSLPLILLAFSGASPISQLLLKLMTLELNLINELTFMYRFPQIIMMTGGHLVYLADCIISVINS